MKLKVGQKVYLPFKAFFSIFFSLLAIILTSWIMLIFAILIKLTSKGPIIFKQDRPGKNNKIFKIYKFRSMYVETPSEVDTAHLKNPDAMITPLGKFMRKTSIDELPQLFNILTLKMAFVGPRPALWNQYDLIEQRNKKYVYLVRPGLTGWAQVNGRDTLSIEEKANFDGEYIKKFGLFFDLKICFLTVFKVFAGKDVKEGESK